MGALDAQVEVSRTLVLDDPRRARSFFEALVADNIGIGRPEEVSLGFVRQLRRPTRHPYRTRIFSTGTEVRIDFRYKHSRVKQYLKDGRALLELGVEDGDADAFGGERGRGSHRRSSPAEGGDKVSDITTGRRRPVA